MGPDLLTWHVPRAYRTIHQKTKVGIVLQIPIHIVCQQVHLTLIARQFDYSMDA